MMEALPLSAGGTREQAKHWGGGVGGAAMREVQYCFLIKEQNSLIICQALPFQVEFPYYIKVNALLLTE